MKTEILRFLVVGGFNTGSTYIIYLLLNIILSYVAAYSIAYVGGICISYMLNARWTFRADMSWISFSLFPLVYLVQYVLGIFLLRYLIETTGIPESFAPVAVIAATLPVTFTFSRMIIKNER